MPAGPLARVTVAATALAALLAAPSGATLPSHAQQAVASAKTLAARVRTDRAAVAREAAALAGTLRAQHKQSLGKPKLAGSTWGACLLARWALQLDPEHAAARELLGYMAQPAGGWARNPAIREDLAALVLDEDDLTIAPARKRTLQFVRSAVGRFAALAKECRDSQALVAEADRPAYAAAELDAWRAAFALEPMNRQARDALGAVTVEGRSYSKAVAAVVGNRKAREDWYRKVVAEPLRIAPVAVPPVLAELGRSLGRTYAAVGADQLEACTTDGEAAARRMVSSAAAAIRLMEHVTGTPRPPERSGALRFWQVGDADAAEWVVRTLPAPSLDEAIADVRKYVSTGIAPGTILIRGSDPSASEESAVLYAADRIVSRVTNDDSEWLSEGLLMLAKLRTAGRATRFYGAKGATSGAREMGAGGRVQWLDQVRRLAETDTDPPIAALPGRPLSALTSAEVSKTWSVLEYLIERDPGGACEFITSARGDVADALRTSVGGTPDELEEAHRAWVLESR